LRHHGRVHLTGRRPWDRGHDCRQTSFLGVIMKYGTLGRTGLRVSELGFGCGMVGGLLVRGEYPMMRRAVARALELGITYFDTAPLYGDGQSEVNLGAVLRELGADPIVGSKVPLEPSDLDRVEAAIAESVETSLRRLGRVRVDLIQLHNPLLPHSRPDPTGVTLHHFPAVLRAFEVLEQQGKVRFWGITGLGETEALRRVVAAGGFHLEQLERAAEYANRGPLPADALARLQEG
jgi:aryl-alcohol dehydrogenase-like predicted oxidoreductase